MLSLATLFVLARICTTQILRPKRFLPQDLIIYFAYTLYLTMSILYILVTPILFRLTAVGEKKIPPYPTLKDDHKFMVRVFFVNTMLFWGILWTVKMGFLVLYKNLMQGLHNVYIKLWWAVVVFWFLVGAFRIILEVVAFTNVFGLVVVRWIDRIAYAGLLEYEGLVYAGSVSDAARCEVADCELVLHVCRGCFD
jgi:hypothetical protein